MTSVRYGIAVLLVVVAPASVLFWVVLHPMAAFWRRVGYRWGYSAAGALSVAVAAGCWWTRGWIAATDLGPYMFTTGPGIALLGVAAMFRRLLQRQLSVSTMLGGPELAPDRYPGHLLSEGIYARMRHPRYAQIMVGALGWALLANHVAGYLAVLAVAAVLALIIPLEERELAERFGPEYEAYRQRVPALIPRWPATHR